MHGHGNGLHVLRLHHLDGRACRDAAIERNVDGVVVRDGCVLHAEQVGDGDAERIADVDKDACLHVILAAFIPRNLLLGCTNLFS